MNRRSFFQVGWLYVIYINLRSMLAELVIFSRYILLNNFFIWCPTNEKSGIKNYSFSKTFFISCRPRDIDNLFEGESLTATNPFDASEVIREAQSNAGSSPRIAVRRLPRQTDVIHGGQSSAGSSPRIAVKRPSRRTIPSATAVRASVDLPDE